MRRLSEADKIERKGTAICLGCGEPFKVTSVGGRQFPKYCLQCIIIDKNSEPCAQTIQLLQDYL